MRPARGSWLPYSAVAAWLLIAACGGGSKPSTGSSEKSAAPPPVRGAVAAARASASASASSSAPKVEFTENDFVETDRSRDPFRSFEKALADQSSVRMRQQRDVLLDKYSVDELKLVGIVMGGDEARALLIDPRGKGWVVRRGQFIGRSELVRARGPSGSDYELNWRVDRIRDGDIVLIRDDPAHSDIPPISRVVPLRNEELKDEP